jgi:hypothetical protein
MELADEFEVPLGVPETWDLLTDVGRIAPCLPGARLDEVVDGEFHGVVRVKVGPITVEYKGVATFAELDEEGRRVVLRASGRETRGQGNASATVTATLAAAGAATRVAVSTELDITGRVAQFGRGALADVSSKLLGQFVKNLEKDLASGGEVAREPTAAAPRVNDDTIAVPVVASNGSGPAAPDRADDGTPSEPTAMADPTGDAAPIDPAASASDPAARVATRSLPGAASDPEPIDVMRLTAGAFADRIKPLTRRAAPFLLLVVLAALLGRHWRRGR